MVSAEIEGAFPPADVNPAAVIVGIEVRSPRRHSTTDALNMNMKIDPYMCSADSLRPPPYARGSLCPG